MKNEIMKKMRAFTLVELLMVIAVIALLLAVLVPSLNKARDLAKRIVCSNHIHTFGVANSTYESTYSVYVPVAFDASQPPTYPSSTDIDLAVWWSNEGFRRILQTDSYTDQGESILNAPKEFLCPADKIAKDITNITSGVLLSYGYNMTEWINRAWDGPGNTWLNDFSAGYGPGMVKAPAEKLTFIDAPDWWVQWRSADYSGIIHNPLFCWDTQGQQKISVYRNFPSRYDGPVFYRHSEGADVGFYDGHAEYMKKEKLFIYEDWTNSKPGMWAMSYRP